MQVINDIVLFLSCYSFVLPPHKCDIPGRRSAVQSLRGLQTKSHFPMTPYSGSNDDNVKKVVSVSVPF
jgi:hypothetical protein